MPYPAKGARLYLRKRKGRSSVYVIRDGNKEIGTGCSAAESRGAEEALQAYLAGKHSPIGGDRDPDSTLIANAMTFYNRTRAPELADPERIATAFSHILPFWGEMVISDIKGDTCRAYTAARSATGAAIGTIRRELEALQAAVRFFHKEGHVTSAPLLTMPPKPPRKERFLSKDEAAAIVDEAFRVPQSIHMGYFILVGLYTGTRHRAILGLQWQANTTGGWIDFEQGVLYRRGIGQTETKKRRPPCRIPDGLLPHLRAAREITQTHVVEYGGHSLQSVKKSFAAICRRTGIEDVTPHTLRHTCGTWLAQSGISMWEGGNMIGCSAAEFERTYAHHSPDYQVAATEAITAAFSEAGAKLGRSSLRIVR